MKKIRVAVIQLNSGTDTDANFKKLDDMLSESEEVDLLALPEVFSMRGNKDDYQAAAETIPGKLTDQLMMMAAERNVWILAGCVMEKAGDTIYNSSLLFNRGGEIVARYRKMHLFEANLDDGKKIREGDIYTAGQHPVIADLEGWKCGMTVCYDVRFPELYRFYSERKASLMFVPSDFTEGTGRNHWEVLIRSRAIENQCFIIAPNQCGPNARTGIESYGNSMVVGPWGQVLGRASHKEEIVLAELDPSEIDKTRHRIPALEHRRL